VGDGQFDQQDIVAALQANIYLTGPYAGISPSDGNRDDVTAVQYDPKSGEVVVQVPDDIQLTSISIDSAAGVFTGEPAQSLGGGFDIDSDGTIFKATFGSSFGSLQLGKVAQPGLSEDLLRRDLTVIGSLAGGGGLGDVQLVYVPEPTTILLLVCGLLVRFVFGISRAAGPQPMRCFRTGRKSSFDPIKLRDN
jgi:hypothetical protein